ncbi:MAG: hypothetical protein DRN96_00435 [Thermoproteota archaeon]|nr:MAG: hypothetical protein DRN96_00435 [Candidatus Korarchaeota archaeon]
MRLLSVFSLFTLTSTLIAVYPSFQPPFSAILVRGDIYPDWVIAMAYAQRQGIPVLTVVERSVLTSETKELLGGLARLGGGRVLIVGDTLAISSSVEEELSELGLDVVRIAGVRRIETSVDFTWRLWPDASRIILADGWDSSVYLPCLVLSRELDAPIIFSSKTEPVPLVLLQAIRDGLIQPDECYVVGLSEHFATVSEELKAVGVECKLVELRKGTYMPPFPRPRLRVSWKAVLTHLSAAIMGVLASYLVLHLSRERVSAKLSLILNYLDPEERAILESVAKAGGVKQEDLPAMTGFNRPKVSRLVNSLVDRGLLVREKVGKTYMLRISSDLQG